MTQKVQAAGETGKRLYHTHKTVSRLDIAKPFHDKWESDAGKTQYKEEDRHAPVRDRTFIDTNTIQQEQEPDQHMHDRL
jgi:hypothetical protein